MKIQYKPNRYYDYYTGRWLTQDPAGYLDSMNLYEYARSQPLLLVDPDGKAIVIAACGAAATLSAAEAAAAIFGVSIATCMMMPECRTLVIEGTAKAIADAISSAASAAKSAVGTLCKTRCKSKRERPHHSWIRPRFGIPPWKKCYIKHVRITCYFKGVKGSKLFETQIPYGPCYKFPMGLGGITH